MATRQVEQSHDVQFHIFAAWSIVLAVALVPATLLVRRRWENVTWKSNGSPTKSTMSSSAISTLSSMEEKILLIIDGCNGPIRFDRDTFLQNNNDGDPSQSLSLLQVVNGENRGNRLSLLVTLERFLASRPDWHADIYFDGLGVDVHSQWGIAGKEWHWKTNIHVKVTPLRDEADNLIVEQVQTKHSVFDERTRKIITLDEALQQTSDDFSTASPSMQNQVLVFQRNSNGPGKSRQILKRLGGLMRPESYFCLFWGVGKECTRDVKSLRSIRHLLVDHVIQYSTISPSTTIVVSDDIFLRQRIVEAGGLVLTFEQLWDMLVPFG